MRRGGKDVAVGHADGINLVLGMVAGDVSAVAGSEENSIASGGRVLRAVAPGAHRGSIGISENTNRISRLVGPVILGDRGGVAIHGHDVKKEAEIPGCGNVISRKRQLDFHHPGHIA